MPNRQVEANRQAVTEAFERMLEIIEENNGYRKLDRDIEAVDAMHRRMVEIIETFFGSEDENEAVIAAMLIQWMEIARKAQSGMLRNKRAAIQPYESLINPDNYLPDPAHFIEHVKQKIAEEEKAEDPFLSWLRNFGLPVAGISALVNAVFLLYQYAR